MKEILLGATIGITLGVIVNFIWTTIYWKYLQR